MLSLKVVNRAMKALGEPPVDTLENLGDAPTRLLRVLDNYDGVVGRTLKSIGRGPFVKHIRLTPETVEGDWRYPFRFNKPSDGLCFLEPPKGVEMELGIDVVDGIDQEVLRATTSEPIEISYVRRCNLDLLPDVVCEAIGLALAAEVAYQFTTREHAQRITEKAADAIPKARMETGSSDDRPVRRRRMDHVRGICGGWR